MAKARTLPQNRLFHAMVREVASQYQLFPWCRALATEAWKRYLLALYVRESRMEAYATGRSDPFPVRPVPSSSLESWQMDELIECTHAFCSAQLGIVLK